MPAQKLFQRFLKIFKKLILFSGFLLFFLLMLINFKNWFSLKTIEIRGKGKIYGIETLHRKNIFFLDIKKEKERLQKINPHLFFIKITKTFPDKLVIEVKEEASIAVLKATDGYFILGKEGKILKKNKKTYENNLPIINFYQPFYYSLFSVGEKITNQEILSALFLIEKLNRIQIIPQTVDINSFNMLIFNLGEEKIFFDGNKDLDKQYEEFKVLIKKLKIQGIEYRVIDMRFNKPIIQLK